MITADKEAFDERVQRHNLLAWYIIIPFYVDNSEFYITPHNLKQVGTVGNEIKRDKNQNWKSQR